jgi:hypothetical protein
VNILATAIGEESFIDQDSNGQFNGNDQSLAIGEPYRDDNENGVYDLNEVFSDFNSNGTRDGPNHADYLGFNGLLCDPAAVESCSPNDTLFVSDQIVMVMSSSGATIVDDQGGVLNVAGVGTVQVTIGDAKNNGSTQQPMAGGTKITATTSNGSLVGPTSYTYPCSNFDGPLTFTFSIEADSTSDSGVLSIQVESPSKLVTTHTITVND